MPLGVRDDIVTASTTRISSTQLNVLHRQLPEGQIVGVHVEVGEEGCSEGVGLRGQVQTFGNEYENPSTKIYLTPEVDNTFLPKESIKYLDESPSGILQHLRLLQHVEGDVLSLEL